MKTFEWNNDEFGEMNFENICRLYSADKSISFSQKPPFIRAFYPINGKKKYSVRWNIYESAASFMGETYGSDYFVLKGKSEIKIDGRIYSLDVGNCYKIPKCKYEQNITGTESFEYIAVYELSDESSISDLN